MKRIILLFCLLLLCLALVGCDSKDEFVFGDNEIVELRTTPRGEVASYEMYTLNIKVYAGGKVVIYADNFIEWLGEDEIPVKELSLAPVMVENIKTTLITENIPFLHENVGSKDIVDGTTKYITVYGTDSEHTVGGISPSNRQFIRAYDYIYELVREEVFIYTAYINEIQLEGYKDLQKRNVKITNSLDETFLTDEYINQVYYSAIDEEDENSLYQVTIEFNPNGQALLKEDTKECQEEAKVYKLHINDTYVTMAMVDYNITDGLLNFSGYTAEEAEELVNTIIEAIQ